MAQKKRIFFAILNYCLVIFASLSIVLTILVLPHAFMRWNYPLPEFVNYWEWWLANYLDLSGLSLALCYVGTFLILAVILSWLSRAITDRLQPPEISEGHSVSLDKVHDLVGAEATPTPETEQIIGVVPKPEHLNRKETLSLSLKILVLIALTILSLILVVIMISTF